MAEAGPSDAESSRGPGKRAAEVAVRVLLGACAFFAGAGLVNLGRTLLSYGTSVGRPNSTGAGVATLIGGVVALAVVSRAKDPSTGRYSPMGAGIRLAWVTGITLVVGVVGVIALPAMGLRPRVPSGQNTGRRFVSMDALAGLTIPERTRFFAILDGAIFSTAEPTDEIRREFRELIGRAGYESEEVIRDLQRIMLRDRVEYFNALYEDALESLKSGKVHRSERRTRAERGIRPSSGGGDLGRRTDEFLGLIAARVPSRLDESGTEVVVTEEWTRGQLAILEGALARAGRLFEL